MHDGSTQVREGQVLSCQNWSDYPIFWCRPFHVKPRARTANPGFLFSRSAVAKVAFDFRPCRKARNSLRI